MVSTGPRAPIVRATCEEFGVPYHYYPSAWSALVAHYRRQRYQQRLRDSRGRTGVARYELQQKIEREFNQEVGL